MGRRGVDPTEHQRWVFNRLAGAYAHRPAYPPALIARVRAFGTQVVELGAGTGHLALALAGAGAEVVAVEPARAMLEELERRDSSKRVRAVFAAAERTGLPEGAFEVVVVADAIQWVDPERSGIEAARLLRAGGVAAVIDPVFADTPFMNDLSTLLERHNPKSRRRAAQGAVEQFLRLATGARSIERETIRQDVPLDDEALEGVLRSLSFAGPALGSEKLTALISDARAIAREHGGAKWTRDLQLSWSRRADRPAGAPE